MYVYTYTMLAYIQCVQRVNCKKQKQNTNSEDFINKKYFNKNF